MSDKNLKTPSGFKTFSGRRGYNEAVKKLKEAGWVKRKHQTGGDFEDFVYSDGRKGLLMADIALGRFILLTENGLFNHMSRADGDPAFDAVLCALFENERKEGEEEPCQA